MTTQTVRVEGWATPRTIIKKDGKILFEVAEENHCSACIARLRHVRSVIASKGIDAHFVRRSTGYGDTLFVVLPDQPDGTFLSDYVSDVLDIRIYPY